MSNTEFLEVVKKSFEKYLETSARSNEKLKILHGEIAEDIRKRLKDSYKVHSLNVNNDKEVEMSGRYMDKKVDIAVTHNEEVIAAIALKFIMSNYSQNSNNYFENMLGETANIRSSGKPYFQILIMPSKIPYFKKDGTISHYEKITRHNLSKYIKLSHDDTDIYMHTPNKTLLYIVDFPFYDEIKDRDTYCIHYLTNKDYQVIENVTPYQFGPAIIYNNYNQFIDYVCQYISSM